MHFVGRPRCIPNDSSDKSRRCKVQDFQLEFFHHRFSNTLNDTERKMESISDAIAMKYILSVKLQLVLSKSTHQLIGFLVDIHQAISIFDVSCTKTLKDEATIFGLFCTGIRVHDRGSPEPGTIRHANFSDFSKLLDNFCRYKIIAYNPTAFLSFHRTSRHKFSLRFGARNGFVSMNFLVSRQIRIIRTPISIQTDGYSDKNDSKWERDA